MSRALWRKPEYRDHIMKAWRKRDNHYTEQENELLRTYAGLERPERICQLLQQVNGGHRRTPGAVERQMQVLGLSAWHKGYTCMELTRAMGVTKNAIKAWERLGLLRFEPWGPSLRVVTEDQVRTFIQQYPWHITPARMAPGPLRALAEVMVKRHPYLTTMQLVQRTGVSVTTIRKLVRRGALPYQRRVGSHGGLLVFDAEVVQMVREFSRFHKPSWAA